MINLKIGALWSKTTKEGKGFMSGKIDIPCSLIIEPDMQLSIFPNEDKDKKETSPTAFLYLSEKYEKTRQDNNDQSNVKNDDIPF